MLEKDKFIEYMSELKSCVDRHKKLADVITEVNEDGWCLPLNVQEEDLIVTLLAELMNDKYEYIIYYIYEIGWGKDGKNAVYDREKDKYYSLTTVEELYDYITKEG
jgi:DNA-binding Lrp family transcriptional regulator